MFPRATTFSALSLPPRPDFRLSWRLPWRLGLLLCLGALLLNGCGSAPKPSAGGSGAKGSTVSNSNAYKIGKPYKVAGTWYYPRAEPGYDTVGVASWYGYPFHGRRTANGEVYDMESMTAAHTTLPLPSYVEVTNLDNGRAAVLRVNDRGPFVAGRIIDVSRRAAEELGFYNRGTARVRVRVIGAPPSDPIMVAAAQPASPPRRPARARIGTPVATVAATAPAAVAITAPAAPVAAAPLTVGPVTAAPLPPPATARTEPARSRPTPADGPTNRPAAAPVYAPVVLANAAPSIYIQAGAFADAGNAERLRMALAAIGPAEVSPTLVAGRELHRVRIGPLTSAAEASGALARLQALGHAEARLVMEQPAGAVWGGAMRGAGLP